MRELSHRVLSRRSVTQTGLETDVSRCQGGGQVRFADPKREIRRAIPAQSAVAAASRYARTVNVVVHATHA